MTTSLQQPHRLATLWENSEAELARREPAWLTELRRFASADFRRLGLPTPRNEDWKFTNVSNLAGMPFRPAGPAALPADASMDAWPAWRLVFVNGWLDAARCQLAGLPEGVFIGGLAEAIRSEPDRVRPYLARTDRQKEHAFTALNTACFRDGAFLHLSSETVLERPVHLLFLSAGPADADLPPVAFPRVLIVAERGSQMAIVEEYRGPDETAYFTNGVSEAFLHDGAVVDHCKLQHEGRRATHIAPLYVEQARGSRFSTHLVSVGGELVRNETDVRLAAEGCTATVNGLYFADDGQHVDNHTEIDHAQPNCQSHELYKGILRGRGRGVFNGKIFVRPNAQKTDAKQTNQTLLLSEDAIVDAKPQLEIFADDVKCTHGATVGQLEENALFYLRSRGIGEAQARSLLTYAFANDVIRRIPVAPVRARLGELLLAAGGLPRDLEA